MSDYEYEEDPLAAERAAFEHEQVDRFDHHRLETADAPPTDGRYSGQSTVARHLTVGSSDPGDRARAKIVAEHKRKLAQQKRIARIRAENVRRSPPVNTTSDEGHIYRTLADPAADHVAADAFSTRVESSEFDHLLKTREPGPVRFEDVRPQFLLDYPGPRETLEKHAEPVMQLLADFPVADREAFGRALRGGSQAIYRAPRMTSMLGMATAASNPAVPASNRLVDISRSVIAHCTPECREAWVQGAAGVLNVPADAVFCTLVQKRSLIGGEANCVPVVQLLVAILCSEDLSDVLSLQALAFIASTDLPVLFDLLTRSAQARAESRGRLRYQKAVLELLAALGTVAENVDRVKAGLRASQFGSAVFQCSVERCAPWEPENASAYLLLMKTLLDIIA